MDDVFRTESRTEDNLHIVINYANDYMADTSYIGVYTNRWEPGAVDREKLGDWQRGEYRYFVPTITAEDHRQALARRGESKHQAWLAGQRYVRRDYERYERLNRGDWGFIGISVEISIEATRSGVTFDPVDVAYASLWGIEAEADEGYYDEVVEELIAEAKAQLPTAADRLEAVAWAIRDICRVST